jgi:hypothetical protein
VAGKALLALEGGVVLLALVCVVWGTSGEERAGLRLAGAIGLVSLALPLLLIGAGQDYFLTRNVIGALVPLLAVVAGGLGAARVGALGVVLAAVLCAGGGMAIASVDSKASLERPDWGGLARALGPAREERAVVVSGAYQAVSLGLYLDRSTLLPGHARPVRVREIDLVGTRPPPRSGCWWGAVCNLPRAIPRRRPPARGFRLAGERRLATFTVLRFRSRRATLLTNARRELHSPLLFRTRRKHRWVVFAQRPSPALSVR